MILSMTIQPFNLYVVPRPLTLPAIFPAPLPHLHPQRVHSASPAGRDAANDAVSGADAGLGEDESGSWPLLPPSLLLTLRSAPAAAGRLRTHLLATFG